NTAYKFPMLLDTQLNLREIPFHAQHPPTGRRRTNVNKQELTFGASRPHPALDQRVDRLCTA
ncbi:hypothetical protein BDR05DRAFT_967254, partial [Suillus weaverae]